MTPMRTHTRRQPLRFQAARRRMAGLTLLEILVAMMIGLIGIVVITQTYLVNENYKRSTTAAGGAQTNGALALYSLERDLRMSGWGIVWNAALGCQGMRWHYNGQFSNPPGGPLPVVQVVPTLITDGGAGAADRLTVFYGSGAERVVPATIGGSGMADSNAPILVDNPYGFQTVPGDLVLLTNGTTCAMTQVTGVASSQLLHAPGVSAPYNPAAAGTLPAFATGSQVFNLGRPVVNTYRVDANRLELESLFTSTSSTVVPTYTPGFNTIVEDIVDLQAEYGKDNGTDNNTVDSATFIARDGRVDGYDNVTPNTVDTWREVLSVRLAVLARSEFYERPDPPSAACTATTDANQPVWGRSGRDPNGMVFPALGDLTDPANQARCYRYRVFETVVPLRNVIWRLEP